MPAAAQENCARPAEKAAASAASTGDFDAPESAFVQSRPMVEEFMSITDGQVFVDSYTPEKGWTISAKDSVSPSERQAAGPFGPSISFNFALT